MPVRNQHMPKYRSKVVGSRRPSRKVRKACENSYVDVCEGVSRKDAREMSGTFPVS